MRVNATLPALALIVGATACDPPVNFRPTGNFRQDSFIQDTYKCNVGALTDPTAYVEDPEDPDAEPTCDPIRFNAFIADPEGADVIVTLQAVDGPPDGDGIPQSADLLLTAEAHPDPASLPAEERVCESRGEDYVHDPQLFRRCEYENSPAEGFALLVRPTFAGNQTLRIVADDGKNFCGCDSTGTETCPAVCSSVSPGDVAPIYVNARPSNPIIEFSPNPPVPDQDLVIAVTGGLEDSDGQGWVSYKIELDIVDAGGQGVSDITTVDNTPVTLQAGGIRLAPGNVITATVKVTERMGTADPEQQLPDPLPNGWDFEWVAGSATVGNSGDFSVSITPDRPTPADDLTCLPSIGDAATEYTWAWTIDGASAGTATNTLSASLTSAGQTVVCSGTSNATSATETASVFVQSTTDVEVVSLPTATGQWGAGYDGGLMVGEPNGTDATYVNAGGVHFWAAFDGVSAPAFTLRGDNNDGIAQILVGGTVGADDGIAFTDMGGTVHVLAGYDTSTAGSAVYARNPIGGDGSWDDLGIRTVSSSNAGFGKALLLGPALTTGSGDVVVTENSGSSASVYIVQGDTLPLGISDVTVHSDVYEITADCSSTYCDGWGDALAVGLDILGNGTGPTLLIGTPGGSSTTFAIGEDDPDPAGSANSALPVQMGMNGTTNSGAWGSSLATADVGSDASDDLIVGSGNNNEVRIFWGGTDFATKHIDLPDVTIQGGAGFGSQISVVGDVDGDGLAELAITDFSDLFVIRGADIAAGGTYMADDVFTWKFVDDDPLTPGGWVGDVTGGSSLEVLFASQSTSEVFVVDVDGL